MMMMIVIMMTMMLMMIKMIVMKMMFIMCCLMTICAQIGLTWIVEAYIEAYTNNSIPIWDVKKHFWIDKLVW